MNEFRLTGLRPRPAPRLSEGKKRRNLPMISTVLLGTIAFFCFTAELWMTKDPGYLDLAHCNAAPSAEFWFGTDSLGRDIFSGILYGGRISLTVGVLATLISSTIGFLYGTISALAPAWLDKRLMRGAELLLSVPTILLLLCLQAMLGAATVWSLSLVLGTTSWASLAKVVRSEVKQLRKQDYIIACKCMGGGFFYRFRRHLLPNLLAPTMFMVLTNLRSAIAAESTLSFLGMGLPLGVISWGSMLSLSQGALLSQSPWILLIPGTFLVTTFVTLTTIAQSLTTKSSANS